MATKLFPTLACIGAALLLSGCPMDCGDNLYAFRVKMTVRPEQEVYRLGDTLWIEADNPNVFHDDQTGQSVSLAGHSLGVSIKMVLFKADSTYPDDAAHHFDVVVRHGKQVSGGRLEERAPNYGKHFEFVETGDRFLFNVGVICRQAGIYCFYTSNSSNILISGGRTCDRASIAMPIVNEEKNLHFLQDLYYKGAPIYEGDRTNGYCFQVIE